MPDPDTGYAEPERPTLQLDRKRDVVETLWTYCADLNQEALILPDGRADVILRFRSRPDGICENVIPVITGPSSVAHLVAIAAGDGFVGVRLRPGRLGIIGNGNALRDGHLLGTDAVGHVKSLSTVPDHAGSIQALIDVLLNVVEPRRGENAEVPCDVIDASLDRLHLAGGRIGAGSLALSLGVGSRRLHRLFLHHVGMGPQLYASVLRFQRAVRMRQHGLTPVQVAHEAGYTDQSHMTRAFRRHGGFTPARMPKVDLGSLPIR